MTINIGVVDVRPVTNEHLQNFPVRPLAAKLGAGTSFPRGLPISTRDSTNMRIADILS